MTGHRAYQLYCHITWSTWNRVGCINEDHAELTRRAIEVAADRNQVHVLAAAILADHVHLLVSFRPATRLSDFVGTAKGLAARTANQRVPGAIRWARGFHVASLGRKDIDSVRGYLKIQNQRHPDLIPQPMVPPVNR